MPSSVQATYSNIPLHFEVNQGQADTQVKFLARGSGYTLFLTVHEAAFTLNAERGLRNAEFNGIPSQDSALRTQHSGLTFRMQLVGANPQPRISGVDELPGKSHYFVGQDPARWRTNVPTYAKVKYEQVYPGIDLVYYGNQQQVEYDFIVAPGADPKAIRFAFVGATGQSPLRIDDKGDLVLQTVAGEVRFHRPHLYQDLNGSKHRIEGKYVLRESPSSQLTTENWRLTTPAVGFEVAAYDATKPLIIDPVLSYSVYVAKGGAERGPAIAVDSSGNAYVAGTTVSAGLPTANPALPFAGEMDVFVAKLDPTGATLLYATYLGGGNYDEGTGIAIDEDGNAYVTGSTISLDFPTTPGAFSRNCSDSGPVSCNFNVFVAKLNAMGSALVYSTYLGGKREEHGAGIAVDSLGNAYVVGDTWSPDFPTMNPFQTATGGAECGVSIGLIECLDIFVTKLNTTGTALVYSSYLGGNGRDEGKSIAIDDAGSAYVTGFTESNDFPTVNPVQASFGGPAGQAFGDAFVAKVNASGSGLVYATYLGGDGWDEGRGIAVDPLGNAYVTGWTGSINFPVANPLQSTGQGSFDAFVTKVSASGSMFTYSFRLGGSNIDEGNDIIADASGNAYVTGITHSDNFPTVRPVQANRGGGICPGLATFPCPNAFVSKIAADGGLFVYSTYLGGGAFSRDSGSSIAVDVAGNAYVTGNTSSIDFPAENPFHIMRGSSSWGDSFVAKIADTQAGGIIAYLESPEDGPVAGIAVVRGWAFPTQPGVSITEVELLINGRSASEIPGVPLGEVPCCSERPDVRDAFPQFPAENTLNSGWGATVNWNWLEPGGYLVRMRIRDSAGNLFFTDSRTVGVVKPGGFEFLDRFDLSHAIVRIDQDPFTTERDKLTVAIDGVVIRDKAIQQQKTINAHFRWLTSSQSFSLIQASTVSEGPARHPWSPASLTPLLSWFKGILPETSARMAPGIISSFEDPAEGQIVSGIAVIRGWAFPERAGATPTGVQLFIDGAFHSDIPCCSAREDVAAAFPDHANALASGWGILCNYGRLTAGPHQVEVVASAYFGYAFVTRHNVMVVKPGGFEFLEQFDLSEATARIDGQEVVLSGVRVRDKVNQQTKTVEVRLRWFENAQGLGIVAARDL